MTSGPDENAESRRARQMVSRFLSLAGVDDPQLMAHAERLLQSQITEINAQGLRESDLAVMGQAYIRAVGRVVAAEAEAIFRVRDARGGSVAEMANVADRLTRLGRDVFDVLHSLSLRRVVNGGPSVLDRSRRSQRATAVAHVDVIGSTALLVHATLSDTQQLVDGLFASAQSAIRGRGVEVTKYVGDGVFLVGHEPVDVAAASLDCIHSLARDTGLKARAGLGYGAVVHRAGDVFGLPVNLAHALTKRADDGSLLATAVAPAELPVELRRIRREITLRGLDAPVDAYELVSAGPSAETRVSADQVP